MAKSTVISQKKKRGPAPTGKGVPILVRMHNPELAALDNWIADTGDMTRPEAVRLALKSWLIRLGYVAQTESADEISRRIDTLQAEAEALKPSDGPPSPAKAMKTMKRCVVKNEVRKLKNTLVTVQEKKPKRRG